MECNYAINLADTNMKNKGLGVSDGDKVDATNMFRDLEGKLRYICQISPNISFLVGLVSGFICNSLKHHFLAGKRIMKYVSGTLHYGILFQIGMKRLSSLDSMMLTGMEIRLTGEAQLDTYSNFRSTIVIVFKKATSGNFI